MDEELKYGSSVEVVVVSEISVECASDLIVVAAFVEEAACVVADELIGADAVLVDGAIVVTKILIMLEKQIKC